MTRRCQLYDYGSVAANVAAYQQPTPPVISDLYHTLRGVPVHLVAGLHDGVIPPTNIKCHYESMRAAGVDVSYREVSGCWEEMWDLYECHQLRLSTSGNAHRPLLVEITWRVDQVELDTA